MLCFFAHFLVPCIFARWRHHTLKIIWKIVKSCVRDETEVHQTAWNFATSLSKKNFQWNRVAPFFWCTILQIGLQELYSMCMLLRAFSRPQQTYLGRQRANYRNTTSLGEAVRHPTLCRLRQPSELVVLGAVRNAHNYAVEGYLSSSSSSRGE